MCDGEEVLRAEPDDDVPDLDQVHRRRAQKRRDEGVGGVVVDLRRRSDLPHRAEVHDDDAVAHGHRLDLVVRDVDRGRADALLELLELLARRRAQLGVEVRQRLVEQEDGRLADDRARERDSLALAAGQLARLAVEQPADAEESRPPTRPSGDGAPAGPSAPSAETRCSCRRSGAGRARSSGTPSRSGARGASRSFTTLAADQDLAGRRRLEAGDHPKEGGLPGAGRPEEDQKLSLFGHQADVVDGAELSSLKTLVRFRVSTTATPLEKSRREAFPLREAPRAVHANLDTRPAPGASLAYFHLAKMRLYSVSAALAASSACLVAARDLGEHGGNDPGAERFGDAGRRVAGIADVRRPVEHVAEDLVLVRRVRAAGRSRSPSSDSGRSTGKQGKL